MRNKKAATCSSEGYSGDKYCTKCGTQIASGVTLEKLPHSWTKKQTTKTATCTEHGKELWECTACHTTQTRDTGLDANNHDWKCTKEAWDEEGAPVYADIYGIEYWAEWVPFPKTDPRCYGDNADKYKTRKEWFGIGIDPNTRVEGDDGNLYPVPDLSTLGDGFYEATEAGKEYGKFTKDLHQKDAEGSIAFLSQGFIGGYRRVQVATGKIHHDAEYTCSRCGTKK